MPAGPRAASAFSLACSVGGRNLIAARTRSRSSYQATCFALAACCGRGVLAPLELGLAVLQADPHHVPPPPRIRDQSNNLASPTVLATATRKGAPAQGHRKFCACGVAGPKILVARGGGVLAPDGERAPIFLAVAPHGGRVAAKAVPAAVPRAAPAARRAAGANQLGGFGFPTLVRALDGKPLLRSDLGIF